MTVRNRSTVFGLAAIAIALSLFVGCGKKKAESKIEEAQAVKQEADGQRMSVYMPKQYQQAQRLLDEAVRLKDDGSYDESVTQAEQAIGSFQGSMTQLATLRTEIDGLWGQIEELRQTIEGHINVAKEQGVVPDTEIEELNGELYFINDRDDKSLKKPERNGSVERDFLNTAIEDYGKLAVKTLAASKAHLKPQAEEALTAVRTKWTEAQSLDAETYKPALFAEVKSSVDALNAAESASNWEEIIDKGDTVSASLDNLLQQTRIAASDAKVQQAQTILDAALQIQAADVTDYAACSPMLARRSSVRRMPKAADRPLRRLAPRKKSWRLSKRPMRRLASKRRSVWKPPMPRSRMRSKRKPAHMPPQLSRAPRDWCQPQKPLLPMNALAMLTKPRKPRKSPRTRPSPKPVRVKPRNF